jgi:hypothetical protein
MSTSDKYLPQHKSDGVIDEWMSRILGKSWKTTLSGIIATACGVAVVVPGVPSVVVAVCQVVLPIATGVGLVAAKDKGVTGGKRRA